MKKLYSLLGLLCCAGLTNLYAQISLNTLNVPYEQDFNALGTVASNEASTLPAGWLFLETGTNANTTYGAGTGSSNTGNTYSFGSGTADRAFGGLLSGSLTPTIGAAFINQTGTTVTSLAITYHGEQWRLGAAGRGSDRLDFELSTDATSLSSGTWAPIDALDFISPVTSGTARALDGNLDANSATLTFTIDGLNIANGAVFYIRWSDFNVSNADDGLAIDDFSIIPSGIPTDEPSISFSPADLAFGEVILPSATTLSYEVIGSNLEAPITVSAAHAAYTLSIDEASFSASVTLPDTGGIVFVRFAPLADGAANTVITHTSGTTAKDLTVTGSGYEQANHIITIAAARTMPAGAKVTVAGRITVANEHGNPAFMQDATGGIPVFHAALAQGVAIGDSVVVTGPIGLFNDQKQISGAGIFYTRIATAPRIIAPTPINLAQLAAHEGLLVTVENVELVNKDFIFYPQSTERITDGSAQADLRIDGDTDIPGLVKPQGITSITGVVGRFRTNAQLLPRFEQDIPGAAEPSTPTDTIARNKTLDVVNWNLEFFGARSEDYRNEEFGPEDEALQLQHVKRVLDTLRADIIAVQEVSDEAMLAELVSQLEHHAFTCSQRFSHSFEGPSDEFPPQKVCFIYDTTTINVLGARAMFEGLYDSARTDHPALLPGYPGEGPSSFYSSGRLPYLLTVDATIGGVTERITLIDIHAKSGATTGDHSRRAYDAAVLKDTLDAAFASENLIILGDLNDDLDESITTGLGSPYAAFVSDTAYAAITKALSDAGARSTVSFGDVIDHQVISNDLRNEYLQGSAQIVPPFRFISNYAATTSDHLPVITRYAWQAPEAQFVQQSTVLTEDSISYVVHVVLNKPVTRDQQLTILHAGNSTYGSDFTTQPAASGSAIVLNLPAGSTSASFTITVINDLADELTETTVFTLQQGPGIGTGAQAVFTLSLEDNDVPRIAFQERYASAEEGSAYTVKLKLSSAVASNQEVTLSLHAWHNVDYGTDYTTEPAAENGELTVTVPAGSSEAQFTITALTDRKHEMPWEPVSFYLEGTSDGLVATQPRLLVFTIIDVRKKPHFVVFPNPTHGLIKLTCEELDGDEMISVELRSPHGELLLRKHGTLAALENAISHKLQNGRKGIYTLKVTVDEESQLIRIIRH